MTIPRRELDALFDDCMTVIQWEHYPSFTEWQFHIGDQTRRIWNTLSFNQKIAVAMDAWDCKEKMMKMDPLIQILGYGKEG